MWNLDTFLAKWGNAMHLTLPTLILLIQFPPHLPTPINRRALELLSLYVLPMEPGVGGLLQSNQLRLWQEYVNFERSNPQVPMLHGI
jgi:hypothetical protein